MRKNIILLLVLGAATTVCLAQPQGGPANGELPRGGRPPQLPIVTALDTNSDGILDSNEIANASAELLTLDKNGDGKLAAAEYLPARIMEVSKDARPAIVKALDANSDVDADEITNAPAALKTIDQNGDGKLTMDELIGRPPHGFGQSPPDNQGGGFGGSPNNQN